MLETGLNLKFDELDTYWRREHEFVTGSCSHVAAPKRQDEPAASRRAITTPIPPRRNHEVSWMCTKGGDLGNWA